MRVGESGGYRPAAARPDRPDRAKKQELLQEELQELLLHSPRYTSNKKKEAKKNR